MILIVCENYRTSKNVALAMGANTETATGIYASNSIAVATIPENSSARLRSYEMADGRHPFIPEKFKMSVTDKELERDLKPLFRARQTR